MKLGDVLKREREARGLSVEALAEKVGLSVGDYRALESAGRLRTREVAPLLDRIARVLGIDRNSLETTPDIEETRPRR